MTNELPLEQTVEPIELVLEGAVEPKEPVEHLEILEESIEMDESMGESDEYVEPALEESVEIEEGVQIELLEPLSLSMDGFEQPELPIANNLKQKVEAVLYLKGQPMNLAAIAEALGCEIEDAEMGLIDLITEYAHRDSALEIMETDVGFSLRLRSEFEDLVHKLIPVDLGRGVLRTLAAIALKKNIVQSELIELRGAGAYQHVQELVEQGFVRKKRQADGGRSSVLQVTTKFHQYFEIDDLTKLI
ncbi:SMC-Scp complex subunit ScpB [Pseudanabaena sp. UWO311]|uniref:SMC-Scp complex subunit ScpB n=1 Tax=Pseudanabaena sp. UWO311 TaxID=2487337 RepID=UPI0011594772|nr:SMC-Scp complex subunit ScpB [Pseudanabaena sp. UWO311]TYQ27206.1 SMC-Scp complex subunit ScpB [Pseudanabaena sp. UWO311]